MSDQPWTVGRYLAELLAANGIDTVFGIPGVHNLELYRGLAAAGLRHILVRHEQNAGFAADGFARVSGRPAAAFVISGPGLTNILTAAAQARSDSVPMLIVASTPARQTLGKGWGALHELDDQRAVAAAAIGLSRSARSVEDVRDFLREAFTSFRIGRRRPAYLDIPLDLLAETTAAKPERFPGVGGVPEPAAVDVDTAVELLSNARRPMIVAGGGARGAAAELRALVDALDAYLICTAAGKGTLPESHPGNLGASLQFLPAREQLASADVVLAVGTELSETDFYAGNRLPIQGRLIRIDVDPGKLGDHYAADVAIWADARASLHAIAHRVRSRQGWRTEAGSAAALRSRIRDRFDLLARSCERLLQAIRLGTPDETAVFTDMTQPAYLGNFAFPTDRPGTWFHPSGYGTLGYALPAAIGALAANPRRPVLALAGDFGFQFTSQELATAVELGLSLPIVLWNNHALGQIRDDMRHAGIALTGVIARNPDFQALARAYGAHALRSRGPEQLTAAIREAFERPTPTLLEACDEDFAAAEGKPTG